jgi:protein gp37
MMGDRSKIEWTDATWNPVTGCTKVSAGCKFCYAERDFHRPYPGRAFTDVQTHPERLNQPLHWKSPRRIFVDSMSDLFHERIPQHFIDDVFQVMENCQRHTFQILTKRVSRMSQYLYYRYRGHSAPSHLWFLTSVENQETANAHIPELLEIRSFMGVSVLGVSYEPALGPLDFSKIITHHKPPLDDLEVKIHSLVCFVPPHLDWVTAGGESGPKARPSHPDWFRSVRDQCQAAGIPFFFKQWGEWAIARRLSDSDAEHGDVGIFQGQPSRIEASRGRNARAAGLCRARKLSQGNVFTLKDCTTMVRIGKKRAGRLLDGREWNEFPKIGTSGDRDIEPLKNKPMTR